MVRAELDHKNREMMNIWVWNYFLEKQSGRRKSAESDQLIHSQFCFWDSRFCFRNSQFCFGSVFGPHRSVFLLLWPFIHVTTSSGHRKEKNVWRIASSNSTEGTGWQRRNDWQRNSKSFQRLFSTFLAIILRRRRRIHCSEHKRYFPSLFVKFR